MTGTTERPDLGDPVVATAPDGRRMLRVEARNAQTPIERKPSWIKTTLRTGPEFRRITDLVKGEGLHTVCRPSPFTISEIRRNSGPVLRVVLIHEGLRSIGTSALRASMRSIRRPSGAVATTGSAASVRSVVSVIGFPTGRGRRRGGPRRAGGRRAR